MALSDLESAVSTPTTRRKIVTTGAKLAYATPVLAASMKLSAGSGLAASPINECSKEAPCGIAAICGDGPCACFFTAEGDTRCFIGEFACETYPTACESSDDCGAGEACADTCCGKTCVPLCGADAGGDYVPGTGSSL